MLSLGSSLPGLDTSILWSRKLMRLNGGVLNVLCRKARGGYVWEGGGPGRGRGFVSLLLAMVSVL